MPRIIPIVMQQGAFSDAPHAQTPGHEHANDASRPLTGPSPVFLRVGASEISEADIAREMQHHRADSPQQSRLEAARALVVRELLRLEVERLGLAADVVPVDGETLEETCIRELIEREAPTPEPDEVACRHYYQNNIDNLHQPDRVRLRHILLAAAPNDSVKRAQSCVLGEQLIADLRAHPEHFTEHAQRHSDCPSKDEGGELGWIEHGQTTPEFERQLFMLRPGLAGLTVESRYGHHVVMVDEIVRGEPLAFAEAAGRIAAYLETQAMQNAIHQYLQILSAHYRIQGLDELEAAA